MSIADRSARRRTTVLLGALLGTTLLGGAITAPAHAQAAAPAMAPRVDRLEKEMRAVQRKVFPDGEQAMLAPEISAPPAQTSAGTPAGAPIADLTARVSSLEQALAQLTGQVEQNGYRIKQLDDQFARFRTDAGARLDRLDGAGPGAGGAPPPASAAPRARAAPTPDARTTDARTTDAPTTNAPTTNALETGAPAAVDSGTPPAAGATATPPTAADPAEEAYLVGYRAWTAKDYPAAEAALKAFPAKYADGKWLSYAQNLLGRTYLDSGRPAAAAVAFHHNYTTAPRGERAPDSLYFLGQALMKLEKPQPAKACEAYDTLTREYGKTIAASLKDRVAKAREDAKCGAAG